MWICEKEVTTERLQNYLAVPLLSPSYNNSGRLIPLESFPSTFSCKTTCKVPWAVAAAIKEQAVLTSRNPQSQRETASVQVKQKLLDTYRKTDTWLWPPTAERRGGGAREGRLGLGLGFSLLLGWAGGSAGWKTPSVNQKTTLCRGNLWQTYRDRKA